MGFSYLMCAESAEILLFLVLAKHCNFDFAVLAKHWIFCFGSTGKVLGFRFWQYWGSTGFLVWTVLAKHWDFVFDSTGEALDFCSCQCFADTGMNERPSLGRCYHFSTNWVLFYQKSSTLPTLQHRTVVLGQYWPVRIFLLGYACLKSLWQINNKK